MSDSVAAALYASMLATALASSFSLAPARSPRRGRAGRTVWATVTGLVVVAVPSLLQLTVAPRLLGALRRDRTAIEAGQWWRLVTSLVVQDGGWSGAVFNLMALLVIGLAAERIWGTRRWLMIGLTTGIGAQFWGLVVQPVGAGNSLMTFGLAASMAVAVLRAPAAPARRILAALSLLVGLALLLASDVHGGAVALGAVLGVVVSRPGASRAR